MCEAEKRVSFKCSECRKKFRTKGGLNLHQKSHSPHIFLLRCPECDFESLQKGNLVRHLAVRHGKNVDGSPLESILCPYPSCSFKGRTEGQMKCHQIRRHSQTKPFHCSHCSYTSVEKAALKKHQESQHRDHIKHICTICPRRYGSNEGLKRHMLSHTKSQPFECPQCPARYADKKRLSDHLLRHESLKPFVCPSCPYATQRPDNLKTHMKRIHLPPETSDEQQIIIVDNLLHQAFENL